jgi:hypothetical protein
MCTKTLKMCDDLSCPLVSLAVGCQFGTILYHASMLVIPHFVVKLSADDPNLFDDCKHVSLSPNISHGMKCLT